MLAHILDISLCYCVEGLQDQSTVVKGDLVCKGVELCLLVVLLHLAEYHLDRVHVVLVRRVEDDISLAFPVAVLALEGVMSTQVVHEHGEGLSLKLHTKRSDVLDELPPIN